MKKNQPVVVLGLGAAGLFLVRQLQNITDNVYAIGRSDDIGMFSKYIRKDRRYYTENDNIKEILANHIISPVRFDKAIKLMEQENVEEYVEIGPGRTLTGFVKKENKEANTFNINTVESLEAYLEEHI